MGMVSTGQSSPELQAAAQQINKWLETNGNVSATNPDLRIAAPIRHDQAERMTSTSDRSATRSVTA